MPQAKFEIQFDFMASAGRIMNMLKSIIDTLTLRVLKNKDFEGIIIFATNDIIIIDFRLWGDVRFYSPEQTSVDCKFNVEMSELEKFFKNRAFNAGIMKVYSDEIHLIGICSDGTKITNVVSIQDDNDMNGYNDLSSLDISNAIVNKKFLTATFRTDFFQNLISSVTESKTKTIQFEIYECKSDHSRYVAVVLKSEEGLKKVRSVPNTKINGYIGTKEGGLNIQYYCGENTLSNSVSTMIDYEMLEDTSLYSVIYCREFFLCYFQKIIKQTERIDLIFSPRGLLLCWHGVDDRSISHIALVSKLSEDSEDLDIMSNVEDYEVSEPVCLTSSRVVVTDSGSSKKRRKMSDDDEENTF